MKIDHCMNGCGEKVTAYDGIIVKVRGAYKVVCRECSVDLVLNGGTIVPDSSTPATGHTPESLARKTAVGCTHE